MVQGKAVPTFKAWLQQNHVWDKDLFGLIWGARCWFIETVMLAIQTAVNLQRNEVATAEETSTEKRRVLKKTKLLLHIRALHLFCNMVLSLTWSRATSFLSRRWCGIFCIATSVASLTEQYLAIEE